jgi:hypothetical protein
MLSYAGRYSASAHSASHPLHRKENSMSQQSRAKPDDNHYGVKDENTAASAVYANRQGGEVPGVGPIDAVDSSGHRRGAVEEHAFRKPSSRLGRDVIHEKDDKVRPEGSTAAAPHQKP